MKRIFIKHFIFILMIIPAAIVHTQGQESYGVTAGLGLPDWVNIGLRLKTGQAQFGLHVGSVPGLKDESLWSVGGEIFYHIAGTSSITNLRPWYGRLGMVHVRDETPSVIWIDNYIDVRGGRVLSIRSKMGFELDAGLAINIAHKVTRKKPAWISLDLYIPVIPAFGARWFLRF
ncbi:MAG: hypothetical protein U1C46_04565 [Bacteroidales bacterium]|nr:hypothetical protein [Bacteroidales bacterium]MDZ4204074.1 hypothetical protein [Bacteroidales bacterium]